MITIVDYISANKAQTAAEGALLLLGISGAIWLTANRGWSNITANTVQDDAKIDLPEIIILKAIEGISPKIINSEITKKLGEKNKEFVIEAQDEELDLFTDSVISSIIDEVRFSSKKDARNEFDLEPSEQVKAGVSNIVARSETKDLDLKLTTEEITGKVFCWFLAKKLGSPEAAVASGKCKWIEGRKPILKKEEEIVIKPKIPKKEGPDKIERIYVGQYSLIS